MPPKGKALSTRSDARKAKSLAPVDTYKAVADAAVRPRPAHHLPTTFSTSLDVASQPALSNTTVHVLKYKHNKGRYIILLQPELGDAATKSLCPPASLVLGVGTAVVVSGLKGAPELNGRTGVVEGFEDGKGRYAAATEVSGGCAWQRCVAEANPRLLLYM